VNSWSVGHTAQWLGRSGNAKPPPHFPILAALSPPVCAPLFRAAIPAQGTAARQTPPQAGEDTCDTRQRSKTSVIYRDLFTSLGRE